jgi:uncharacterized protein YcfJ
MRRILTIAGLIAAISAPSLIPAQAWADSCEQRAHQRKVTGTLLGALGGGLLGNAVSHHGGGGTLIGAGVGAVVGNNLARVNCDRRVTYRTRTTAYPASYRASGARTCRYETRPFYDAHGQLVYAPTQVCG